MVSREWLTNPREASGLDPEAVHHTAMNIETLDSSTDIQDEESLDTIELLEEIKRKRETRRLKVSQLAQDPPLSELSTEDLASVF